MADDASVPCVARSSATRVLNMHDKNDIFFQKKGIIYQRYPEIVMKMKIYSSFLKSTEHDSG